MNSPYKEFFHFFKESEQRFNEISRIISQDNVAINLDNIRWINSSKRTALKYLFSAYSGTWAECFRDDKAQIKKEILWDLSSTIFEIKADLLHRPELFGTFTPETLTKIVDTYTWYFSGIKVLRQKTIRAFK